MYALAPELFLTLASDLERGGNHAIALSFVLSLPASSALCFGLAHDPHALPPAALTAAYALASLSQCTDNKVPMQAAGALDAAVELLRAKDRELRRHGGALGCNLCLHRDNKRHVVSSELLPQLHIGHPGISVVPSCRHPH